MFWMVYFAITTVCTAVLLLYATVRIKRPFDCSCGFKTRFVKRFKKHVLQSHRWH